VEISLSPLETEDGVLVSSSIRDVTDRKKAELILHEKNLELKNANLAKDNFLASMSHELRTPLNAIIGFTGTLLMKLPGPLLPDQERHLRTVHGSGYPDGLKGDAIPITARIMTTVDRYDSLTTDRPYRSALSSEQAFSIIHEEVRRGWWDAHLVEELRKLIVNAGSKKLIDAPRINRAPLVTRPPEL